MCKRLFLLFSFVLVLGLAGSASAYYTDDFESYNATDNIIYDTWDPTGATDVYYYRELFIMYEGTQSLKLWFDNSYFPYYCGVSRTDAPSDWTLGGDAAGLSFWFRGDPSIDQMYVRLTDSSDRVAVVKYSDAWNPSDLLQVQWRQWRIRLRYFTENNTDFDMTAVKTLEIGIGEPNEPAPGVPGGGEVFFDDIRVYTCVFRAQIDLNNDCVIDGLDLYILANEWLDQGGGAEADVDQDGGVNFRDYAKVVGFWLGEAEEIIPEGHSGIASNYPGDIGIEQNSSVVFTEDFETRNPGGFEGYWTDEKNAGALTISSNVPSASPGSRSLQVTATRGQNAGGYLYKLLAEDYDQLYARLYVKFAPDYGFNHHFCKLAGDVLRLPWPTGGAGQLPYKKFITGLEPTTQLGHQSPGTSYPPPGFWHFYTYWPEMRSWQTPEGESDPCNPLPPYYGNDFTPLEPTFVPRDEWICLEWMIRVNYDPDDPDSRDGVQRFWINGELTGNWSPGTPIGYWMRATFRIDPGHQDEGPFEGFRWRNYPEVKLNIFRIENYVSEGAFENADTYKAANPEFLINTQQAACSFDHLVIATDYIGPIYPQ